MLSWENTVGRGEAEKVHLSETPSLDMGFHGTVIN